MKVVAINGSPHKEKGNTELILAPFLTGMKEAGAEIKCFYTKDLKIHPCQGDFTCWLKTPGTCFQRDDMHKILNRLAESDVFVLATPVYVDGVTGPLKNVIDRMIPLATPFIELREDHCRHPRRTNNPNGKLVLVSNCGLWERDNFDPILMHMKALGRNMHREFAGALLRPHGAMMKGMMQRGMQVEDVFAAANQAGHQLVRDGVMRTETLNIVSRELLPRDKFIAIINRGFKRIIDRAEMVKD